VVRNGGTLTIYLNGTAVAADNLNGNVVANNPSYPATEVYLGCAPWGYNLSGALDEVGCWQRALAAAEVEQLYNAGLGLAYENF
jgi:hypothetical protein